MSDWPAYLSTDWLKTTDPELKLGNDYQISHYHPGWLTNWATDLLNE